MPRPVLIALSLLGCSTHATPEGTHLAPSAAPTSSHSATIDGDAGRGAAGSASASTGTADAGQDPSSFVLVGGSVFGLGQKNLLVQAGRIKAVGVADDAAARVVNVAGRYVVPGFIDSHVHLAYDPVGEELLSNGIVAVLDLAAPLPALSQNHAPLVVMNAGPMITARGGYPVNSWGADGYGLEVDSPEAAAAAVETLFAAGARVIKVPLTEAPTLDDAAVKAVVAAAHARGLKVFTHALDEPSAARAAADGIDVLAHTPVEALSDATLAAWQGRTVIATLAAFGGEATTVKNLHDLRERGTRVLYGTDFGNTRDTHIQEQEITLMIAAGMDGASIVTSGTSAPAAFLGLGDLGTLEVGKRASFLVLERDPTSEPHALSQPLAVYVDGKLVSASL